MNVAITLILIVIFVFFGFGLGCFACMHKINDLEFKTSALTEWLEASRTTNTTLIKENEELRADIEAVINGGHIIASTITADKITVNEKERTNTD